MTATTPLHDALRARFGDRFSTAAAVRDHHGKDDSHHPTVPPDAVVFAQSTDDVAFTVRACARHRTPVIPFGAGTSIEGHVQALRGGISIDMSGMNRVLAVRPDDLDATVEAGVTRLQLDRELRGTGLFFPVDPGADATLGGMAATGASGTTTVRYGTMRDNVVSLTAVLASGEVVRTGGRARKSSAGYDLTHLLVGSEGTLAVITKLTVRLHPVPEAMAAAVCAFPGLGEAVQSVVEGVQLGVPVARAELLDATAVKAVNLHSGFDYDEVPTVFFEFHGTEAEVRAHGATIEEICRGLGGTAFRYARRQEERTRLWKARHDVYPAILALRPGSHGLTTDVCVPVSRLAECISATRDDMMTASIPWGIVGHIGDGNFHAVFLIDPDSPAELAEAEAVNERIVRRALAMEGTCTGEHGIGMGKIGFLHEEFGDAGVGAMRAVKAALDPEGIMNPGKVVEDRGSSP
ncbi:MAG: FAD-binding protein [Gemmatimonadetes bacterium]|nr:FAD-binding protein [Gemmatimonadota bacterium]MYK65006.1 FAD-binding protein [Gemmatimonadota bacterium]